MGSLGRRPVNKPNKVFRQGEGTRVKAPTSKIILILIDFPNYCHVLHLHWIIGRKKFIIFKNLPILSLKDIFCGLYSFLKFCVGAGEVMLCQYCLLMILLHVVQLLDLQYSLAKGNLTDNFQSIGTVCYKQALETLLVSFMFIFSCWAWKVQFQHSYRQIENGVLCAIFNWNICDFLSTV